MALAEQRLPFPFIQGIDTKSDPKTVGDFSLGELRDAVFSHKGELCLRNGQRQLATNTALIPPSLLAGFPGLKAAQALVRFDDELLVAGSFQLHGYNKTNDAWVHRGPLASVRAKSRGVVANDQQQTHPDVASLNGITVYAYEDSPLGSVNSVIRAVVYDETTGTLLLSNQIGLTGSKPKCVAVGAYIYVFYLDGLLTSLNYWRISAANPTSAPVTGTLISAGINGSTPFYAIRAYGSDLVLSYVDGSSNLQTTFVGGISRALGQVGNLILPPASVGSVSGISALNLCVVGSVIVVMYAVFASPNTNISAVGYTGTLAISRTAGIIASVNPGQVFALTGCASALTNTNVICFYEVYQGAAPAPTYNARVRRVSFATTTGGGVVDQPFVRSVGLLTEAFLANAPTVGVTYDSALQPKALFIDTNFTVVARLLDGRCGGLVNYSRLSSVVVTNGVAPGSPAIWISAVCGKGRVVKSGQTTYQPKNVAKLTLDYTQERSRSIQLGRSLHIAGGSVSAFDGGNGGTSGTAVTEDGFNVYPEAPTGQTQTVGITLKTPGKSGTTPQVYTLTLPADIPTVPIQSCASRLRPGEYFILFGANAAFRCYVWFNIAGVGTDPAPGTVPANFDASIKVSLGASDNQAMVASKVAQAITQALLTDPNGSYLTATVQPDNTIQLACVAAPAAGNQANAVADTQLGITTTTQGTGGAAQVTRFTFPGSQWIAGGQYFVLNSPTLSTAVAFYFTKDGLGAAPVLAGVFATQVIAILTGDTPAQVATKAAAQIGAFVRSATTLWPAPVVSGPIVDVTCGANGATPNAYNGSVGGIPLPPGPNSVSYKGLYSWLDGQGHTDRSSPSAPYVVNIPAQGDPAGTGIWGPSGAYYSNTLTVAMLRVTRKSGVKVELYRTEVNGGTHYREASASNDLTIDSLAFLDTTLDNDLRAGETLYTTGGELPNFPPPPTGLLSTWQGRAVVVDDEDPTAFWVSKAYEFGTRPAFHEAIKRRVDAAGGDITAIFSQDSNLIIAKRSRLFVMAGDGPDKSGQQASWTPIQALKSPVGVSNPDSIVATDLGTFFQSDKGLHLLTGGLEVLDLGVPAYAYRNAPITAAVLMPAATEVRFLTADGLALIYDYEAKQWGTLTAHNAVDAQVWDGVLTLVTAEGDTRRETPDAFLDAGGARVSMRVLTNWINLAGLSGFGRVRKVHVLGEYRSPHKLSLACAFDHDPATAGAVVYDPQPDQGGSNFGDGSPYGTGYFGDSQLPNSYHFRWYMPRQKCTSVRFEIETVPGTGSGESVRLSGLMLECGVKKANKPAAVRSIG